jgi:predicted AlkP superfamily pyrophosphatase or phosphodiesterase
MKRTLPPCFAERALAAALLALALVAAGPAGASDGAAKPNAAVAQQTGVVLVSIDGFRWDFPQRYPTPNLDRLAATGLKAEALQPVWPTLTFPNHYSIATGVVPARHGIVANTFPDEDGGRWYALSDRAAVEDGSWYLAEPIWVTAEKHGMPTAAFYFVGTEADVGGVRPTRWHRFDADVAGEARVAQVLDWLAEPAATRPRLVTLYFDEVDSATHDHGIDSPESRAAIAHVDALLGTLLAGMQALPDGAGLHLVLVSDHGAAAYRPDREPFILDQHIDLAGTRRVAGGPYVHLWFDEGPADRAAAARERLNSRWDCGRAWLREEAPATWQVGSSRRFPDLIVQAETGCAVLPTADERHRLQAADHGWPPEAPEMRGILYAAGPRIRPGARPGLVHVTDIHPLLTALLGLPAPALPDGDPQRLAAFLYDGVADSAASISGD